ncbi:MAG: hypothetical protein ACREFP_22805, partial [Acetobacteraceae bacterium]
GSHSCLAPAAGEGQARGAGDAADARHVPHRRLQHGSGYHGDAHAHEDGRFKVAETCREWREEFEGYHRKAGLIVKANDDLLSATRIGVMQLRSARAVGLGSTRRDRSREPQIAEGTDFDVFNP